MEEKKVMNLAETNQMLLNTSKFSDIVFVVLGSKDDEQPQRFPAHKVLVSSRSPVFEAMFYGPDRILSANHEEEIEIEIGDGVKPDSFNILLSWVYTDTLGSMDDRNVINVLFSAKKFELEGLRVECLKKAKEMLKNDSKKCVLPFLRDSQTLNEDELTDSCLELISSNSQQLLSQNREAFVELNIQAILAIVKLDILSISEYDLFMLVCEWAAKEAEREQLDNGIRSQRFVLLNVLPLIRFPTMDREKLAIEVRQTGLLTTEELNELYSHVLSKGAVDTKYPTIPRQSPSIPCLGNSPLSLGQKPPSPHGSQHSRGPRQSPPIVPLAPTEKPASPIYALQQFSVFNHELPPPKHKSLTKNQSRSLSAEHNRKISDQASIEGLYQEVEGESSPGTHHRQPIAPVIINKPRARSD